MKSQEGLESFSTYIVLQKREESWTSVGAGGIPVSKGDAERSSVSQGDQVHMLCDVWRRQVFWNIKGMGELTVVFVVIFCG